MTTTPCPRCAWGTLADGTCHRCGHRTAEHQRLADNEAVTDVDNAPRQPSAADPCDRPECVASRGDAITVAAVHAILDRVSARSEGKAWHEVIDAVSDGIREIIEAIGWTRPALRQTAPTPPADSDAARLAEVRRIVAEFDAGGEPWGLMDAVRDAVAP